MVAVDVKNASWECKRHPCCSINVKYVVTVTSHTVWYHDAIRHSLWRILPYTAAMNMTRLRVGDKLTWNFGYKQIGVLRRIIASPCVCKGCRSLQPDSRGCVFMR
jgi:hypothetical protein